MPGHQGSLLYLNHSCVAFAIVDAGVADFAVFAGKGDRYFFAAPYLIFFSWAYYVEVLYLSMYSFCDIKCLIKGARSKRVAGRHLIA